MAVYDLFLADVLSWSGWIIYLAEKECAMLTLKGFFWLLPLTAIADDFFYCYLLWGAKTRCVVLRDGLMGITDWVVPFFEYSIDEARRLLAVNLLLFNMLIYESYYYSRFIFDNDFLIPVDEFIVPMLLERLFLLNGLLWMFRVLHDRGREPPPF